MYKKESCNDSSFIKKIVNTALISKLSMVHFAKEFKQFDSKVYDKTFQLASGYKKITLVFK